VGRRSFSTPPKIDTPKAIDIKSKSRKTLKIDTSEAIDIESKFGKTPKKVNNKRDRQDIVKLQKSLKLLELPRELNAKKIQEDSIVIKPEPSVSRFDTTLWSKLLAEGLLPFGPHKNSLLSTSPQHVYEIFNISTGETYKFGISGNPLNKRGESPRANSQVALLNQLAGKEMYGARILGQDLPNRPTALSFEQSLVNAHKNTTGAVPRGNRRPSANDKLGPGAWGRDEL
jgi:hypothetical protein